MNDDDKSSFDQRKSAQIKREVDAFESDPIAKAQAQLDFAWQTHLDLQAIERAPRTDYSPVRRFEAEMDDAQERADEEFARRR
jgi:hypothetical protein